MVYISKLASGRKLYSLFTYKPYDDNRFFSKIDSLICDENNPSDNFIRIVEEIVSLYKDELVFNLETKRNYDYICPVVSNEKFYSVNKRISKFLSEKYNVPLLLDFFNEEIIEKVDYKDKYTKDDSIGFSINEKYLDNDILFIDVLSSTGSVLDFIASKFNEKKVVDFLTVGVRFNAPYINNSKVQSIDELDFNLPCLYNDGYVVEIEGLFMKNNVKVDLRRNLVIVIGANGVGKSTAYKIATLAISNNVKDVLSLAKFYFKKININKYVKNELVNTNSIEYKDIIPSRTKIIKYFSTKTSNKEAVNKIRQSLIQRLRTIFDDDKLQILNENNREGLVNFLKSINDEEYIDIIRKLIFGDDTCKNDIIRIIRKDNSNLSYNTILSILTLIINNKFLNYNFSLIETSDTNFFDCTVNRGLKHEIYKREIIIDEDSNYHFEEYDYYDEEYDYYDEEKFNDYIDGYFEDIDLEHDTSDHDYYYQMLESYEDESYEDESYDYEYDRYIDRMRARELSKSSKVSYWAKDGLKCLYRKDLINSLNLNCSTSLFNKSILIDNLFRDNEYYHDRVDGYINTLDYCNDISSNIDEELEKNLNEYILQNQFLIQFGLYSILEKVQFDILTTSLKNKHLKNRRLFVDSFKKIVEASKNSISKKMLIVEKILNKYYVGKKVNVLNNTIYVLDDNNYYVPINALSTGEKNLMIILLYVALNSNSIVFDEPELSMNITWQNELIKDIFRLQHPNQRFTILTQTPQLITYPELSKFITSIYDFKMDNFEYYKNLGGSSDVVNCDDLSELEYKSYNSNDLPF